MRSGVSAKTGNPWYSLVLESPESEQVDVTVPAELQADVMNAQLRKGELIDCVVLAVSSQNYSYIRLVSIARVYDDAPAAVDF